MKFLSILFFGLCFSMASCGDSSKAKNSAREALGGNQSTEEITSTSNSNNTAPAEKARHYSCQNNCVGGGGDAAGNCPKCGSPLVHNSAFHGAQEPNPVPENQPKPQVQVAPPGTPASAGIAPPGSSEPPQNEKGIWHFTCAKGCAGGGGSITETCNGCGGPLAHNLEYHAE